MMAKFCAVLYMLATLVFLSAETNCVRSQDLSISALNTRANSKFIGNMQKIPQHRIHYQVGKSELDLPSCAPSAVCNKIDVYDNPWVLRQCRCPGQTTCTQSINSRDGLTIVDRNRQYKLCEPIRKLPKCRYFRDVTWSYITYPSNVTHQVVHCRCPKNSIAYIIKRTERPNIGKNVYQYSFACSPQTKLRCQRKEPCVLFSVKKRKTVQDVNTNGLCHCPHNYKCPKHHTDPGVFPGKSYSPDDIKTYTGYCS